MHYFPFVTYLYVSLGKNFEASMYVCPGALTVNYVNMLYYTKNNPMTKYTVSILNCICNCIRQNLR